MIITLPGSKSITNRALILAALAEGESLLDNVLFSDDTEACVQALRTLGVNLEMDKQKKQCRIQGVLGKFPIKKADIFCQDAGTVTRFLLAACANTPNSIYRFSGSAQLQSRPIAALLNALRGQGLIIDAERSHLPLKITQNNTGLPGGLIKILSHESSQFLSALLMIAPYAQTPITLETEHMVSEPYVYLTRQMMREFGVSVVALQKNRFYINSPQHYHGRHYLIEPDLSTASYFFAAAAITGGTVTIPQIHHKTCIQGDIAFLDILKKMGCVVNHHPDHTVTVQGPRRLSGITVNMQDISDTMMTLACLAPFADRPTTITDIGHARLKESDRIAAIATNLRALGIETNTGPDHITIFPGTPTTAPIASYNDHRIAMAFSLIQLKVPEITIHGMECVSKTCPDFPVLWQQLTAALLHTSP